MALSAEEFLATAQLLAEPMVLIQHDGRIEAANQPFALAIESQHASPVGRQLAEFTLEPADQVSSYLAACSRSGQMIMGALTLHSHGKSSAWRCDGVSAGPHGAGQRGRVLLRLRPRQEALASFVALNERLNALNAQTSRRDMSEQALRRERETLRVTLSSIGDAVVVTDSTGRITFMNPIAEALTGWSLQEATGRALREVFRIHNEQSGAEVDDPVARVIETGAVIGLANHTVLRRRDGSELPIDDSAAPIRLGEAPLTGVVLIFRDITQRRAAERTRNRLAAIIESTEDAVASKTLEGIITSWNRGAERLFGYSADEIIGQPIFTVVPPQLYEQEREILARLRAGQRIEHFDTQRLRKDGTPVDISLTVSPIRDSSGAIVGASKIARDITQRKRMETDLLEADRRKDEFLATLAHELRNPLAPIRTSSDVLSHLALVGPARSACEIIQRQVAFMTRLVDELLDVARINSGRIEMQREPLDLRSVMVAAVEACRPDIDAAHHQLDLHLPQEPVIVLGDRVRLAQIFANVLGNAAKYTPSAGCIAVSLQREQGDALVRIRDNGIGIDPHKLNYVFELFSQLERSYERTGGGLGIGLALARRLVMLHEGQIHAHSAGVGKGSEFTIRLPLEQVGVPLAEERAAAVATGPSRRVLIADDNEDAAASLAMLIESMGHRTRVVYDGAEAVRVVESFRPELAILDIGMPKLNGYEVAQRLKQAPWMGGTLLVALTGWGQQSDRQRAFKAGFHDHLVKPASIEALEALFGRLASPPEALPGE
ncbi:MAG TPA: PAS domain S-box protein [Steroidobacteraceae bacterium]|jgi:PAS domain S-box-containing protein|nr:PAS domain S-box protein [Steroidobacteraceae bacterium]